MPRSSVSTARRGFLISIGAGGIATAAAVVSAVTPDTDTATTAKTKPAKRGYQVSEHINKYYRTTRV